MHVNEAFEGGPADLPGLMLSLSTARRLDEVMALVRRGVRHLLGADGATFVLREGNQCYYADEDAISPLWKGQRFPVARCISGWVMQNGKPAAVPDIFKDPRIPTEIYRLTFVRSLLMVPVGGGPDAVAAIGAYWSDRRGFSASESATLATIANAASVALVNISLYHSLAAAAELSRQKAEEAERAMAAKTRFLAAASHDLRQPFQAMRLYHDVLAGRLKDEPGTNVALQGLGKAMQAGEQLLATLLDVSILDAGVVKPNSAAFPISELLTTVVEEHRQQADAKNLKLRLMPCRTPVFSDQVLLGRMIRNLLANAIRYTHDGGILVGCRHRGDQLCIEVWDTGIGIGEDKLSLIFEEFYQVGNQERDREQGLGLGLSVVSKMGRLLGHEVTVRSKTGRGSVFTIVVPLASCRFLPGEPGSSRTFRALPSSGAMVRRETQAHC